MSSSPFQLEQEKLIGKGLTSGVYSWGEDRVLKLFFSWIPKSKIEREFAVTQAVHAAGVPVAAAFEILQLDDRYGIVFERVRGPSLLRQVEVKPWTLFAAARQLAELHVQIHTYAASSDMPLQRDQMKRWVDGAVDFTATEQELARDYIAQLPPSNCVCHGDFHPDNILMAARGPVIIDWAAGTSGHPLADVARTSVLFESASLPPGTPLHIRILMKIARRLLHKTYLKRYFELSQGNLDELEKWRVPQRMTTSAWREERNSLMKKRDVLT